jgi:hypothetical protein
MKSGILDQRDERVEELKQQLRHVRMTVVKEKDKEIESLKERISKLVKLLKFVGVKL